MSYASTDTVTLTTDTSGAATGHIGPFNGRVNLIAYTKDDFADGVDFTTTSETTGQTLWTDTNINASETVAPRQATHSTAGAAALYASGGEAVLDGIFLVNERVKIVIASGGAEKSGTFRVIVEGAENG